MYILRRRESLHVHGVEGVRVHVGLTPCKGAGLLSATTNPLPRENQVPVGGRDWPRFIIFYYTWGNVSSRRGTAADFLARSFRRGGWSLRISLGRNAARSISLPSDCQHAFHSEILHWSTAFSGRRFSRSLSRYCNVLANGRISEVIRARLKEKREFGSYGAAESISKHDFDILTSAAATMPKSRFTDSQHQMINM